MKRPKYDDDDDDEDEDNEQLSRHDDKVCITPTILEARTSHPNCNTVHELSFAMYALLNNGNLHYIISGVGPVMSFVSIVYHGRMWTDDNDDGSWE